MADLIFLCFAFITVAGAIGSVAFSRVMYNALSLGVAFFGIAGLYVFLHAEFLAMFQVIVYIGAISVAIVFAIMLTHPSGQKQQDGGVRMIAGFLTCLVLFALLYSLLSGGTWQAAALPNDTALAQIGRLLLTRCVLPFELISLVLLVAIIGALTTTEKT